MKLANIISGSPDFKIKSNRKEGHTSEFLASSRSLNGKLPSVTVSTFLLGKSHRNIGKKLKLVKNEAPTLSRFEESVRQKVLQQEVTELDDWLQNKKFGN